MIFFKKEPLFGPLGSGFSTKVVNDIAKSCIVRTTGRELNFKNRRFSALLFLL